MVGLFAVRARHETDLETLPTDMIGQEPNQYDLPLARSPEHLTLPAWTRKIELHPARQPLPTRP